MKTFMGRILQKIQCRCSNLKVKNSSAELDSRSRQVKERVIEKAFENRSSLMIMSTLNTVEEFLGAIQRIKAMQENNYGVIFIEVDIPRKEFTLLEALKALDGNLLEAFRRAKNKFQPPEWLKKRGDLRAQESGKPYNPNGFVAYKTKRMDPRLVMKFQEGVDDLFLMLKYDENGNMKEIKVDDPKKNKQNHWNARRRGF